MFLLHIPAIFCGRVFLWIIPPNSQEMRDLQVHPIYGVEPVSQDRCIPAPGGWSQGEELFMRTRVSGSKLHRKRAALARRNACHASVLRGRQDAEGEAGNRSPDLDGARKSDVGDGQ